MPSTSVTEKMKAWSAAHPEQIAARQERRERNRTVMFIERNLADLMGSLLRSTKNSKQRGGFKTLLLATAPLLANLTDQSPLPAWLDTPEKRRLVWAHQTAVAIFQGDRTKAGDYAIKTLAEDSRCLIPLLKHDAFMLGISNG